MLFLVVERRGIWPSLKLKGDEEQMNWGILSRLLKSMA